MIKAMFDRAKERNDYPPFPSENSEGRPPDIDLFRLVHSDAHGQEFTEKGPVLNKRDMIDNNLFTTEAKEELDEHLWLLVAMVEHHAARDREKEGVQRRAQLGIAPLFQESKDAISSYY